MSLRHLVLALCGLVVLLTPGLGRAAERDFTVEEAMVPMRDGTRLYTLIVAAK
ncbi:MAG: hypothetical protein K0R83_376, partial [Caulobacter sp.]|nr:hypothetical protein [Caulobacter sp.]